MQTTRHTLHPGVSLAVISGLALFRVFAAMVPSAAVLGNFSPLGAMAMFSGAYFPDRVKALSFPLVTLFLSDLVLTATVYAPARSGLLYGGWYLVYGTFAVMTFASGLMLRKVQAGSVFLASLAVVTIHWLLADLPFHHGSPNLNFWANYSRLLVLAIPFEARFLAATVVFSFVCFGAAELFVKRFAAKPESRGITY